MRFEASLDILQPYGRRFLTKDGRLVTLSRELVDQCEGSGISPSMLSEVISDFNESGSRISSSYLVSMREKQNECNVTKVIDLWITDAVKSTHVIMTVTGLGSVGELRFVYPEFFGELAKTILSNNVKYDCSSIVMTFPYMFVVFDTFNAFKKVYNNVIEGIVRMNGSSFMFSKTEAKSLIWEVDTPKVDYISNELIPNKMKSLIEGDYS